MLDGKMREFCLRRANNSRPKTIFSEIDSLLSPRFGGQSVTVAFNRKLGLMRFGTLNGLTFATT